MNSAFVSWSGGKDSALALYKMQTLVRIETLVTHINAGLGRIAMHEVREELLISQAEALGIRLTTVRMPDQPDAYSYRAALNRILIELREGGCRQGIFGDLFLEDLKRFREQEMALLGVTPLFPLWGISGRVLTEEVLGLGFKAVVVCVDARKLDRSFCGRELDAAFLRDLPSGVDPAGENGEFHTFVYDGPNFRQPVCFHRGNIVYKEYRGPSQSGLSGFYFCDLMSHVPKTIQP